jgi:hypothetical protein
MFRRAPKKEKRLKEKGGNHRQYMIALADGGKGCMEWNGLKISNDCRKAQGILDFSSSMEELTVRVVKVKALRIKHPNHKYNPQ